MFTKRKIFLTFLFFMIWVCSFSYINLAPTTLDKNIKAGAYQEFNLYNDTTIPFRYKITPVAMTDNELVKDMSKWVEVYPKIVTVNPTESKKFKVYVKADKNAETGDYGTFLNIRQMSAPKLKGEEEQNIGAGMVIMVNLNMGIYGYVGEKEPKIETTEPTVYKKGEKSFLKMKLANKTNRLVRLKIEVEGKRNYFYTIGETRAFKGQTLEFDHEINRIGKSKASKVIITDVETDKVIKEIKIKK